MEFNTNIDLGKYAEAVELLEKSHNDLSSSIEIQSSYEKIIEINQKSKNKYFWLALESYCKFLAQNKIKQKSIKYFSMLKNSIFKYEQLISILIDNGEIQNAEDLYIELLEYLRLKKQYHQINERIKGGQFKSLKIQFIAFLTAIYILDIKSAIIEFDDLRTYLLNKNIKEEQKYFLISELLIKIQSFKSIHPDLDLITIELLLHKRLIESNKGANLKNSDIDLIKEITITTNIVENIILCIKLLSNCNKKNIAFEMIRYLEKIKSFDYFYFINKDIELRNIIVEFRKYQTGIIKINEPTANQDTREFKFEKPKSHNHSNKSNTAIDIRKYIEIYKGSDNVEEDLISQCKLNNFDSIQNKEDLVICFFTLDFLKLTSIALSKYEDEISLYFKANFFYETGSYFECLNSCNEILFGKDLNENEFLLFTYLKAESYLKLKKIKEASKYFSIVQKINPQYRNVAERLNEIKDI